jgi:hypothetical protein
MRLAFCPQQAASKPAHARRLPLRGTAARGNHEEHSAHCALLACSMLQALLLPRLPPLTSRVEPLRRSEALGVSDRPPALPLLAPAAAAAAAAPSAERRGMGASALK